MMAQFYSHAEREKNPHALPDAETFYHSWVPLCDAMRDDNGEVLPEGWYYWFCFPGCMPDGEPIGPFDSEELAIADAREFAGGDE